jgi:hypothetical protein
MSSWRRKLVALFPEHRGEFEQAPDIAQAFIHLSLVAHGPHEAYARDATNEPARTYLQRLHGFAEWSLRQPELWEYAAVGFYEDLFSAVRWEWIIPWLSPFAVEQTRNTWALGISGERAPQFDRLLAERTDEAHRSHVYATRVSEDL